MALPSTPSYVAALNTTGQLMTGASTRDDKREYAAVQNLDAAINLRVYVLDVGQTAPASMSQRYFEVGPGELWERRGRQCPANPLYIASASGTIAVTTEVIGS